MNSDVIKSLHSRQTTVSLIKLAISQAYGESLYKGDSVGHEFHGNRYTGGIGGQSAIKRLFGNGPNDGGFSYKPTTGFSPPGGKIVSPYPDRSKAIDAKDFKPHMMNDYYKSNKDLIDQPNHFFGGWLNKATGQIFFDVSIVVPTHEEAVAVSKKHDQIAYYDADTGDEVTVDVNATSGGTAKGDINGQAENGHNLRKGRSKEPTASVRCDGSFLTKADRSILNRTKQEEAVSLIKSALSPDKGVSLYKGVR